MLQRNHDLHRRKSDLHARALTGLLALLVGAATLGAQSPRVAVPTPPPAATPTAVVQLEGGEVARNAALVLMAAHEGGFLATKKVPLKAGSSVCDVLRTSVGLPGACGKETLELARRLNPDGQFRKMSVNEAVIVPVVAVRAYEYSVKYDRRVPTEQKRKDDVEQNWKGTLKGSDDAGHADRLTFTGYEMKLEVDSDERLRALVAKLQRQRIANVVVSGAFAEPPPRKAYALAEPGRYYQSCLAAGALPANEEGDLASLVGRLPDDCQATCSADECSEVILIETKVSLHPDLDGALLGMPAASGTIGPCVAPNLFSKEKEHGTHLAGIIGARKNGKGVAGVDPLAIIQPVDRALLETQIGQLINDRDQTAPMPIYAFASSWQLPPNGKACGSNAIAKRICDLNPLWIAAAGDEGRDISPSSNLGPMNIGDQKSVVIVSACEDCGAVAPRLMSKANRSAAGHSMVHIAAPGRDIPSTVGDGKYNVASGTSQSVAFAAGVASAMRRCWPVVYDRPDRIKVRLQVTSRPFGPVAPGEARPDTGLAAGVLDAGLALLDPTFDYVWSNGTREQVKVKRVFGQTTLDLRDPVSNDALANPVPVNTVARFRRFPGSGSSPDQWVVYSRPADSSRLGEVVRTGPGVLDTANQVSLEMCDGSVRTLAHLDDVLLSKTSERTCP